MAWWRHSIEICIHCIRISIMFDICASSAIAEEKITNFRDYEFMPFTEMYQNSGKIQSTKPMVGRIFFSEVWFLLVANRIFSKLARLFVKRMFLASALKLYKQNTYRNVQTTIKALIKAFGYYLKEKCFNLWIIASFIIRTSVIIMLCGHCHAKCF